MKEKKLQSLIPFLSFIIICYLLAQLYSLLRVVNIWVIFGLLLTSFLLFYSNFKIISKVGNNGIVYLFLLFFVIRIFLLYYQSTQGNLPMGGSDWGVFHENGIKISGRADNFIQLIVPPSDLENRGDFYDRIVAVVYYFFGPKTQYMYFFSYIMSEIVLKYIIKISLLYTGDAYNASVAGLIFYVWPLEMIFSVAYLREMTIQCIFVISFYFFIRFLEDNKYLYLILAFLFAYFCTGMHSGMIAVFVGYISVFFFYKPSSKELKITPIKIIIIILVIILIYSSGLLNAVTGRFSKFANFDDVVSSMGSVQANTDYIGAPGSLLGLILQLPLRFIYFIVSPLPWQIRSIDTLIAFLIDGVLRCVFIFNLFKNYRLIKNGGSSQQKNLFKVFFIIWIFTEFVMCFGTNNYGTAMRHRLKVFPMEIMLMYVVMHVSEKNQ